MALVAALALACGGCVRPIPPESATGVVVGGDELDRLWSAALAVLTRLEFIPDRQDRAAGIIETKPLTSRQFWETWRMDTRGDYALAQASLQTIQRKAQVRFRRMNETSRWQVDVEVDVYRLQRPERQVTSTAAALEFYGSRLPTTEGQVSTRARAEYLEPLGRDETSESQILELILNQAGVGDVEQLPEAAPAPGSAPGSGSARPSAAPPAGEPPRGTSEPQEIRPVE